MLRETKSLEALGMSINDKLSMHFTLKEFLDSQTASRRRIPNIPNEVQVKNMKILCAKLLEPVRKGIRETKRSNALLMISSGFRSSELNKAVGGSKISQHMKGQAVDMYVWGVSLFDTFKYICESGIEFDQLIWEYDGWIHISYNPFGINRNQILSVKKVQSVLKKKNKWRSLTRQEVCDMKSKSEF